MEAIKEKSMSKTRKTDKRADAGECEAVAAKAAAAKAEHQLPALEEIEQAESRLKQQLAAVQQLKRGFIAQSASVVDDAREDLKKIRAQG
jgi:hypothetical protein